MTEDFGPRVGADWLHVVGHHIDDMTPGFFFKLSDTEAFVIGKGLFFLRWMSRQEAAHEYPIYPMPCRARIHENRGEGTVAFQYEADLWTVFQLPAGSTFGAVVVLRLDPSAWSKLDLAGMIG